MPETVPGQALDTSQVPAKAPSARARLAGPVPDWAPVAAAAVMGIGILVGLRGTHTTVMTWGRAFWQVTYGSGFIRRGIVGTLCQGVYGGLSFSDQSRLIIEISVGLVLALLTMLASWLAILVRRAPTRSHAPRLVLITLPIIGSSLIPSLVFETGYLDVILLVIALVSAACIVRGWTWAAIVMSTAGPFVRGLYLNLWIPVVLLGVRVCVLMLRGRTRVVAAAGLCVPVVAMLIVIWGSSASATRREIALHVTGTPSFRAGLANVRFGQGLQSAPHATGALQARSWWPAEPVDLVYFAWPALVAVTLYGIWRWHLLDRFGRAALAAAVLSPWATLAVAWDESRLILLANAMTLIIIFGVETRLGRDHALPAVGAGWVARFVGLTLFAVCLPFVYAWLPTATQYDNGPLRFDLRPLLGPILQQWMHLHHYG